jgi:hypothetical protein
LTRASRAHGSGAYQGIGAPPPAQNRPSKPALNPAKPPKFRRTTLQRLDEPLHMSAPSFVVRGAYLAINPCDERCYAGEVMIRPDARSGIVQLSGELFTLRRVTT